MRVSLHAWIAVTIAFPALTARAQTVALAAPTSAIAVGPYDVAIVRAAEQILASPDRWNRADTTECSDTATTFSIRCAIMKAVDATAGVGVHHDKPGPILSQCRFDITGGHAEGSCGTLWDEVPVFQLAPVPAITSGIWRSDIHPVAVWSGTMADGGQPVEYEALQLANAGSRKNHNRLAAFNDDTATTFKDMQAFLHSLEGRVLAQGGADLVQSMDSLELEIYADSTGVIRTYNGWYPVKRFAVRGSTMSFEIDTVKEVPPSALDKEILIRAAAMFTSDSMWNRADNRKCPAAARTLSLYCAVEKAEIEVTGGFSHRRPVMQLIRDIIDERVPKKTYPHREMGYNNDPATTIADVKSLFAEAIARIK